MRKRRKATDFPTKTKICCLQERCLESWSKTFRLFFLLLSLFATLNHRNESNACFKKRPKLQNPLKRSMLRTKKRAEPSPNDPVLSFSLTDLLIFLLFHSCLLSFQPAGIKSKQSEESIAECIQVDAAPPPPVPPIVQKWYRHPCHLSIPCHLALQPCETPSHDSQTLPFISRPASLAFPFSRHSCSSLFFSSPLGSPHFFLCCIPFVSVSIIFFFRSQLENSEPGRVLLHPGLNDMSLPPPDYRYGEQTDKGQRVRKAEREKRKRKPGRKTVSPSSPILFPSFLSFNW